MAILGLKSPLYIFFFTFYQSSGRSTKIFVFFHVFVTILLWRVVCIGFSQLVTMGTSVLDDSDYKHI